MFDDNTSEVQSKLRLLFMTHSSTIRTAFGTLSLLVAHTLSVCLYVYLYVCLCFEGEMTYMYLIALC